MADLAYRDAADRLRAEAQHLVEIVGTLVSDYEMGVEGALREGMIDRTEAREGTRFAADVSEARRHVSITLDDLSACALAEPADAPPNLNAILSALPHLTGDELRRVAEAMPRVAGEWEHRERWGQRTEEHRASRDVAEWEHFENKHQAADSEEWDWTAARPVLARTWDADEMPIETWHETPRAAQAACDARLEAAGVRLCGEIVKEGGT